MYGQTQTYKQIQSFELSTETGNPLVNRNKFPRWNANGDFNKNIKGALPSECYDYFTDSQATLTGPTSANAYHGGVFHPDGSIYGIPRSVNTILKINTKTDTITNISSVTRAGTVDWVGCSLGDNGMVYASPYNATNFLKFDPYNQSVSYIGNSTTISSGTDKYGGLIKAYNGNLYGIPLSETRVVVFDPRTDTFRYFGNITGTLKWYSGCLALNGKIYCAPFNSTSILVIDPQTESTYTFGNITGTSKYSGGVLAPNGKIYFMPVDATAILVVDPYTETTYTFGSIAGTAKYYGGALGIDGLIYAFPNSPTTYLVINPNNDTVATYGALGATSKYFGCVASDNGNIYGIRFSAGNTLRVRVPKPSATVDSNFPLNRHFNKF